jgi:tetratricopeptide (TPR) repeat protein
VIKNKIFLISLSALIISAVFFHVPLFSQTADSLEPDSLQKAFINQALAYVYIDSFPAAIACMDSLIILDSRYYPAQVIKAGIIYTEMTDDERLDNEDYFKDLIDSAVSGIDEHLDKYPDDKWALFFKGTALGYFAVWEGQYGSWFKAVVKGLKAGKYFSKAVKIDSLFYEAYLGLGNLHYWRSAKLGIIRKLPFISDRREQGISELQLVVDSADFSATAASIGLAWIYIDRKDYKSTVRVTQRLINEGINGRQTLWPRAIAEFNRGNAGGSISNYTLIRDGLLRKGNQNYYNLTICGYCLGVAHYWKKDYQTARQYFEEILSYKMSPDLTKRASKKLKRAENYLKKIDEKLESLKKDGT